MGRSTTITCGTTNEIGQTPGVVPSGGVENQSNVLELQSIGEFDVPEEAFMRTIPLVAITFAALSLSTIGASR
jgi:hypothetical protein